MSLRKKIKQDLQKDLDLNFDVSKLEDNKKVSPRNVKRGIFIGAISFVSVVVLAIVAIPVSIFIMTMDISYKPIKRSFSLHQARVVENNSFKSLNTIVYPDANKETNILSGEERSAYLSYCNEIYQSMDMNSEKNTMFSPLTLYGFFMSSYGMISDENVKNAYNSLLGLDETTRVNFYQKLFENNFNCYDNGIVELHNGAFIQDKGEGSINNEYIDYLTSIYNEAFALNFKKNDDVNKMVDWVNKIMGDNSYLKKDDLYLQDDTVFYLFSTLYFNMKWQTEFRNTNSYKDNFYAEDGTNKVNFMKHRIYVDVYEYPDYVVVTDKYDHDYSVTYIVPKSLESDINELVDGINIFNYDEAYLKHPSFVDLDVPTFNLKEGINFKKLISNLGLGIIFESENRTFNNLYNDNLDGEPIYLSLLRQKNMISFTEEGTIIKSLNIAGGAEGVYYPTEGIQIKLNQPFIYIVRDQNNLPIYVGHMDNPLG